MDLNKTYQINIISQRTKRLGLFLVVERFSDCSSQHFLNYYRKLRCFNQCSEWFQKLEYPTIEVGSVVLTKINENTKTWSRGIITRYTSVTSKSKSQLYLIDSQRIVCLDSCFEFRFCPPKFSSLVLPTYNIEVDFGLDNGDLLQSAIEMLIEKNQCGDISFNFIPHSITRNNIYLGELIINYEIDNSIITLEKFIKTVRKKKKLYDPEQELCKYSIFDPLSQINSLPSIFYPKDFSKKIFSDLNQTTSFYELNHSNDSLESDESASLNNSEYYSFSDDTTNKITKTDNCDSTEQLKSHSYISSSENDSYVSIDSFDKTHSEYSATINSLSTEIMNLSTEQNLSASIDFNDESKLNLINSTSITDNLSENSSNSLIESFEKTHRSTSTINSSSTEIMNLSTEQNLSASIDFNDESKLNLINSTAYTDNMSKNSSNSLIDSFEKTHRSTSTINSSLTRSMNQNTGQNENACLDTDNESKLKPMISISSKVNVDSTLSDDGANIPMLKTKLESNPTTSVDSQEIEVDTTNYETGVKKIMKNYFRCLRKLHDANSQKDNGLTITTQKVMEAPKKSSGSLISYGDGVKLWWPDSDESEDET